MPTNFTKAVNDGLKSEKLMGLPRVKLVSTIADAIHAYKAYPTHQELQHVAIQMVTKWPFLAMANGDHVRTVL